MVKNICGVPPPPQEENHEAIDNLNNIVQGIKMHRYNMEGLAQSNAVLTSSNTVVMAQLAQMTVMMNTIPAQLKTLESAPTNQTRPKRKYYCWS